MSLLRYNIDSYLNELYMDRIMSDRKIMKTKKTM